VLHAQITSRFITYFFYRGSSAPSGTRAPQRWGFEKTFRHATIGRASLDEWSSGRRGLYLYNKHSKQIPMPTAGFEPAILPSVRPQTYGLDRAATGIGYFVQFFKQSHYRPWGFQEVEAPRFQDNQYLKVVRLSALRTGRLYSPGNIPGTHFC